MFSIFWTGSVKLPGAIFLKQKIQIPCVHIFSICYEYFLVHRRPIGLQTLPPAFLKTLLHVSSSIALFSGNRCSCPYRTILGNSFELSSCILGVAFYSVLIGRYSACLEASFLLIPSFSRGDIFFLSVKSLANILASLPPDFLWVFFAELST